MKGGKGNQTPRESVNISGVNITSKFCENSTVVEEG
jgi:hypothetical protein